MIDLTPLDVRKKREDFKRAVRGYDPLQVDAFLDVVADRLEQLVREHGSLSERVGHLETSLKTYQERERALNEALLAAQELREEARSQAERDAAVRLREAETHAEAILLDADQAIRHSQRRLEDLRARRRQFLKSLRGMMERFDDYLELEDTRLQGEAEDLGDLLERLQTDLGDEAESASSTAPASDLQRVEVDIARTPQAPPSHEARPEGPEANAHGSRNGGGQGEVTTNGTAEPADRSTSDIPAPTPMTPGDTDGPGGPSI